MRNAGWLLLALCGPVVEPAPTRACSGPTCIAGHVAPAANAEIPAGAPAVSARPAWYGWHPLGARSSVDLLDDKGAVLPADVVRDPVDSGFHGLLIVPKMPFRAGAKYAIRWETNCDWSPPDGGTTPRTETPFFVAGAAPMPDEAGRLLLVEQKIQAVRVPSSSGSCTQAILAATARFAYEPSAAMRPWLPLVRITTRVDGQVWAASNYGAPDTTAADYFKVYRRPDRFYTRCLGPDAGSLEDGGLTPGAHRIEVVAHVAGAVADPPPMIAMVTLSCEGAGGPGVAVSGCSLGAQKQPVTPIAVILVLLALGTGFTRRLRRV